MKIEAIKSTLQSIHKHFGPSEGNQLILDEERHHYLLLLNEWEGARRYYNILVHIEYKEDLVWLHEDNTELILAERLIQQGIPENEIVLAWQTPQMRAETGFAVGE